MALSHEQVLQFVRSHGPSTPNDVRQGLKATDNFIVGAILGELFTAGKLKMTQFSLGTSRFYYDPQQPAVLERVMHLQNEKNARASVMLQTERVLRNATLEPIMRVALTNIPDYAAPVHIPTPQGEELFWRYYLLTEQEAKQLISERYFGGSKPKVPPAAAATPEKASVHEEAPAVRYGKKNAAAQETTQATAGVAVAPQNPTPITDKPAQTVHAAPTAATVSNVSVATVATQTTLRAKPVKRATSTKEKGAPSEFMQKVLDYFTTKHITITEMKKSSKSEVTCLVSIPSAVGSGLYFCKAKAKKSTSDGDLASAVLEAQEQKLPLFYIAGGTLSKKAHALLPTQLKGSVVVTPWA